MDDYDGNGSGGGWAGGGGANFLLARLKGCGYAAKG